MGIGHTLSAGLIVCLLAGGAHAVGDEAAVPFEMVREKVERARDGGTVQEHFRREEERRAKAEERVEKIHRLSPGQVSAWVASDQSDEALERVSATPPDSFRPASDAIPNSRRIWLAFASAAVVVLGALFLKSRRDLRRRLTPPPAERKGAG